VDSNFIAQQGKHYAVILRGNVLGYILVEQDTLNRIYSKIVAINKDSIWYGYMRVDMKLVLNRPLENLKLEYVQKDYFTKRKFPKKSWEISWPIR
jgi:hypothetical protein